MDHEKKVKEKLGNFEKNLIDNLQEEINKIFSSMKKRKLSESNIELIDKIYLPLDH